MGTAVFVALSACAVRVIPETTTRQPYLHLCPGDAAIVLWVKLVECLLDPCHLPFDLLFSLGQDLIEVGLLIGTQVAHFDELNDIDGSHCTTPRGSHNHLLHSERPRSIVAAVRAWRPPPSREHGRWKMQIIIVLCVGLLMWVGPADAQQQPFSLTVGIHTAVDPDYKNKIDKILEAASKVLEQCNVTIERKGDFGSFGSPNGNGEITGPGERDAVHRENFDIKVVKSIGFCRGAATGLGGLGGIFGCSWDPLPNKLPETPQRKSIIVAETKTNELAIEFAGKVWAHEFGHFKGLPHRDEPNALMVTCEVGEPQNKEINSAECSCVRGDRCDLPDSGPPHCDRPRP